MHAPSTCSHTSRDREIHACENNCSTKNRHFYFPAPGRLKNIYCCKRRRGDGIIFPFLFCSGDDHRHLVIRLLSALRTIRRLGQRCMVGSCPFCVPFDHHALRQQQQQQQQQQQHIFTEHMHRSSCVLSCYARARRTPFFSMTCTT